MFDMNMPTWETARKAVSRKADSLDKSIAEGVDTFVTYMDKHPGFSAILAPGSVLRRIAYRQTDEAIDRSRR